MAEPTPSLPATADPAPPRPAPGPSAGPGAAGPVPFAASLADFAALARDVLPPDVYDFVAGGSGAEAALAANRAALDRVAVLPRALRGVDRPRTDAPLLGHRHALPVAVAPMAYQRLVHPDGEPALAAAAAAAGVPYVASTLSSATIEEIAAAGGQVWFQLYWLRDRSMVRDLVDRAHAAGCTGLMVTVDVPILGPRLRDVRNGFALPPEVAAANLPGSRSDLAHAGTPGTSAVARHTAAAFASALTWDDIGWLAGYTDLPLVVKGVLDPRDAVLAADAGADAVVVSNHGGRQLDAAPAGVTVLPEVLTAVGDRCEVLVDGGVSSGVDVLRALALGAAGALVGRPLLWALAAGGRAGVDAAFALLAAELRDALTLAGCADPAEARDLRTITEG
ncbi:alpha-hydroxy acid oxidase [Micromonospora okii]|uniref:alpha-hydroxy acid oxidase n=1 Tax=Micromonospora okii TaxID=1182970 RepID=UPI001E3D954A|nr:alpha-hydroxy acid oxidase [Micromonospora okii]